MKPIPLSKLEKLLMKFFRYSTIGPALTRFYICPHVKIHYIKQSDSDFHTHPWNGFSIIFGVYKELYLNESKPRRRFLFNRIYANKAHQVLIIKPVWTLFINFKRINENWWYGEKKKPWEGSDQERLNATT